MSLITGYFRHNMSDLFSRTSFATAPDVGVVVSVCLNAPGELKYEFVVSTMLNSARPWPEEATEKVLKIKNFGSLLLRKQAKRLTVFTLAMKRALRLVLTQPGIPSRKSQ